MPKPVANQEDEDPTPYLFVSLEQRRIDQSKPYDSKKSCWIPDEKEGYLLGEIKATKGDIVSVGLQGGEVKSSSTRGFSIKKKENKISSSYWRVLWSSTYGRPKVLVNCYPMKKSFWYYKKGFSMDSIRLGLCHDPIHFNSL